MTVTVTYGYGPYARCQNVREAGLSVCCGGILGLGESHEVRLGRRWGRGSGRVWLRSLLPPWVPIARVHVLLIPFSRFHAGLVPFLFDRLQWSNITLHVFYKSRRTRLYTG